MWRPNEPAVEDISDLPGNGIQSKRRSRRRAWRDGLADQTVVQGLEDVRSYRAFERTLVGSVDPRSVIELALVHRLASLLWRLRRACAIETGLFEMQGELLSARRQDPSRGPSQARALPTVTVANGHSKGPGPNGRDDPPISDQDNALSRPCGRRRVDGRSPAPSPNVSCASPILTRPCSTALAATKRDYGAKPPKQSGHLTL